jgi:hypothetical protein
MESRFLFSLGKYDNITLPTTKWEKAKAKPKPKGLIFRALFYSLSSFLGPYQSRLKRTGTVAQWPLSLITADNERRYAYEVELDGQRGKIPAHHLQGSSSNGQVGKPRTQEMVTHFPSDIKPCLDRGTSI